jgi:hypothetical protein
MRNQSTMFVGFQAIDRNGTGHAQSTIYNLQSAIYNGTGHAQSTIYNLLRDT